MHGLIAFLERFQRYQNLGGAIELRQCLDPVILQMIMIVYVTNCGWGTFLRTL